MMASINRIRATGGIRTHEGGAGVVLPDGAQLRRHVLTTLLWEPTFYEGGDSAPARIAELIPRCRPSEVSDLAVEARQEWGLRHVPLFMAVEMLKHRAHASLVRSLIPRICTRGDQFGELLALYWMGGKRPIASQLKRGLADAFANLDAYQVAKYGRRGRITLRDVMFLVHPRPASDEQARAFNALANNEIEPPVTWETVLSSAGNSAQSWRYLLEGGFLGELAFIRNIRNMRSAGLEDEEIARYLSVLPRGRFPVWPHQWLGAARYAGSATVAVLVDKATQHLRNSGVRFPGETVLLVDVSGSMVDRLSGHSEFTRMDVAASMACAMHELCERLSVYTFSDDLKPVCLSGGMLDWMRQIINSQPHNGTWLQKSLATMVEQRKEAPHRLIVLTDEQSADDVQAPYGEGCNCYMVNLAAYKPAVGFGSWVRVSGWSDGVFRFIYEYERAAAG